MLVRRKYLLVFGVTALVAGSDLWTKRWAERNLATDRHLLVVPAEGSRPGLTVGDLIRSRWPDRTDQVLDGAVYRLGEPLRASPDQPVMRIEANGPPILGLVVADAGELGPFVRLVDRPDPGRLAQQAMQSDPSLTPEAARARVSPDLDRISVDAFLAKTLSHLSDAERRATIEKGLYPFRGVRDLVRPPALVEPGAVYLLAERQVVLIPDHLDFSYTENPAGAWGFLSNLDDELRRTIFFVLSLVAVGVVIALLIRPPSERPVPLIALGGILGGAIGNVVDRLQSHYVVDFIHMYWGDYHWPRYNIADIGITVGVIVLLLTTGRSRKPRQPDSTAGARAGD